LSATLQAKLLRRQRPGVAREIQTLGCEIDLLSGDVSIMNVEKAFRQTTVPIAGVVQGAMALKVY
jgi:hypothetical protein